MITVVPALAPVTTPEVFTVATDGVLEIQVPPVVAQLIVIEEPTHSSDGPVIGATTGAVITLNVAVAAVGPQLLLTV